MPKLKLLEMDSENKMIYFRKGDKIVAFDAEVAIELIADVLDDKRPKVVRCKDCKHYGKSIGGVECQGYCKKTEYMTKKDDDFCSWGERREDAEHKEKR